MTRDKVLVTGASGFIAKHVVLELLSEGFEVRGSVRNAERADEVRRVVAASGHDPARCEFVETDLESGAGWDAAATGCRYVLHTASPFPLLSPGRGEALVATARKGTDFVLRAAARADVERAVVTSSVAAIAYGHPSSRTEPFGEADVTNVESRSVSSYARSKTLAERTAWDVSGETGLPISTINPGLVLGPLLDGRQGSSAKIVSMMLRGWIPFLPDIVVPAVDVRDVATAHVRALVAQQVGRRFLMTAPDTPSLPDMAAILADAFPDRRWRIPRRILPSSVLRLAGALSPGVAMLAEGAGRSKPMDTSPAREILSIEFIPARDAVVATAESLLRHRVV